MGTLLEYMASWTLCSTRRLNENLATSAKKLQLGQGWIFQQDIDPHRKMVQ